MLIGMIHAETRETWLNIVLQIINAPTDIVRMVGMIIVSKTILKSAMEMLFIGTIPARIANHSLKIVSMDAMAQMAAKTIRINTIRIIHIIRIIIHIILVPNINISSIQDVLQGLINSALATQYTGLIPVPISKNFIRHALMDWPANMANAFHNLNINQPIPHTPATQPILCNPHIQQSLTFNAQIIMFIGTIQMEQNQA